MAGTWVDLKGPQGDQGIQGETGTQGIQGEEGPTGPQGPSGVTVSETEPTPEVGLIWFKASTGDLKVCTAV